MTHPLRPQATPSVASGSLTAPSVTYLPGVRVEIGLKRAELAVDTTACADCDEDHAPSCGYALAIGLLPAAAALISTVYTTFGEILNFIW